MLMLFMTVKTKHFQLFLFETDHGERAYASTSSEILF